MKSRLFGFVLVAAVLAALSWGGPSGCGGATCGDGVIGGKEVCDGGALNGESCESQGFSSEGTLACASDCGSLDASGCVDKGTVSGLTFISGDDDESLFVQPDASGNSYLSIRSASPSVTVGDLTLANPAATPSSYRASAARLNNDGAVAWLLPFHGNGTSSDNGANFAFDAAGNAFFTGDFYGTALTAPDSTMVTNVDPTGNTIDAYAGRFKPDGSLEWFDKFQSANGDQVFAVFDAAGGLYLTGNFNGLNINVGSTPLTNEDGVGATSDAFIARLDPATGTPAWVVHFGSDSFDSVFPLADASGNVFFWGDFTGTKLKVDGTDELTNADPTKSTNDTFVGRLDPATGDLLWIKSFSSSKFDFVNLIADEFGRLYAFGGYNGKTLTAPGGGTLTNTDPSETTADDFVARIDPADGALIWLSGMGSSGFDLVGLQADAAGDLFLSGLFQGPTFASGSKTLANADGTGTTNDNFISRLDPADGATLWITGLTGPGSGGGFMGPIPFALDSTGNVYLAASFGGTLLDVGGHALTNVDGGALTNDTFAAKLAPDGSVVWVTSFAGDDNDFLRLSFNANSENPSVAFGVFVSGGFTSTSLSAGGQTLVNADASKTTDDAFSASLNPSDGSIVWLVPFSSAAEDFATLVTDAAGHLHFQISFDGPTLDVGGQTFTNKDPSGTTSDVVVGRIAR